MKLFLIGYRGTGKTTVARLLAQRLGIDSIDADEALEARAGRSIREIFASDGEEFFRDLESRVVRELAEREGCVVSLGGGAVMRPENRAAIACGKTIWLQAPPDLLWRRLQGDPSTAERRPNLTEQGGMAEIEQKLVERNPVYAMCADLVIDTQRLAPAEVVDRICEWLEGEGVPWTSG